MGTSRGRTRQVTMWVPTADLPKSAGHPFYERLNRVLDEAGFDAFVEAQCASFYADGVGRPSLAPGRYFRLLLLGYFEGLDSERAISWRAADSLSIRTFLDFALHEAPPDHSTLSRTRRLIDLETHQAVFTWVLQRLADATLVVGRTVGIDATTLEANAAMRSIVRRDTGESYDAFLTRLAEASGLSTPTRAELVRIPTETDHPFRRKPITCRSQRRGTWNHESRFSRFLPSVGLSHGLRRYFGSVEADVARGLALRMDHGSQYLSDHFLNQLRYWGIHPSFGFLEEPETNGVVERWNRTLKEQAVYGRVFQNLADVRAGRRRVRRTLQPVLAPRKAGVSHATRSARGIRATPRRVAQTCVQETGCGTVLAAHLAAHEHMSIVRPGDPPIKGVGRHYTGFWQATNSEPPGFAGTPGRARREHP